MEAVLLVKYPYKTWKHKTKEGIYAYQVYAHVSEVTIVNELKGREILRKETLVFFQDEINDYELVSSHD